MRVGDWEMRAFLVPDDGMAVTAQIREHTIQGRTVIASHPGKQLAVEVHYRGDGAARGFLLHWNASKIAGSNIGPGKSVVVRHVRGFEGRVEFDFPLAFEANATVECSSTPDSGANRDWSSSVFSLQPLEIVSPGRTAPLMGAVKPLDNVAASETALIKKGLSCGVQYGTGVLAAALVDRAIFSTRHIAPPLQMFVRDRMLISLATQIPALPVHIGPPSCAGSKTKAAPRRRPTEYVDLTADDEDIKPCLTPPPRAASRVPEEPPPPLKRRRV